VQQKDGTLLIFVTGTGQQLISNDNGENFYTKNKTCKAVLEG
jgi:hypothetical protein